MLKTIIVYYSFSGSTKRRALELAAKEGADVFEVTDRKKPGTAAAYIKGCFNALRGGVTPIAPVTVDLTPYDRIILMAPVWAGHPAPPINNLFSLLPSGADVEMVLVSASGKSSAEERVRALVEARRCRLTAYRDIKEGAEKA